MHDMKRERSRLNCYKNNSKYQGGKYTVNILQFGEYWAAGCIDSKLNEYLFFLIVQEKQYL